MFTIESMYKESWKYLARRFKQHVRTYCENTTLHGFRYITSPETTIPGKLTWLLVCLLSSSLNIYLMLSVWKKYTMTPTVISVESTTYPIWGFPFPAITICNFNKVYKPQAAEYAKKMKLNGMNDTEIENLFNALPAMIHEKFSYKNLEHGMETLSKIDLGPEYFMYHLMQPCNKLILQCYWIGTPYNCTKIVKTVKTSQGYCCSFNYHVLHGEFPHEKVEQQSPLDISEYPGVYKKLTVPGSGRDYGLFLLINVESDTYVSPIRPYFGASVVIHDPLIFPEINLQPVMVQPGQDVTIHVRGSIIESEESLRSLNLQQRKCWFPDENKLNSSSQYRYESCITECRMEHINALCGCVPFYYPNTIETGRTCSLKDIECIKSHRATFAQLETPMNYENINVSESTALHDCRNRCMPECTERTYSLTTESAYFMPREKFRQLLRGEKKYFKVANESAITIYFPDVTCLKYRREIVMTWENLLASFGGIFGLCVGGSFVSLIELIYFLMIRIFRPRKIEFLKKICCRKKYGSIEKISITRRQDLQEEWKKYRFGRQMDSIKRKKVISRKVLNLPKPDVHLSPFSIDVEKPHFYI